MSLKFVVLSDCRCGGTTLVKSLGMHSQVVTELEKALSLGGCRITSDWFSRSFDDCDGWLLQRSEVEGAWDVLCESDVAIVSLRRESVFNQYRSWMASMKTGIWIGDCGVVDLDFDVSDYRRRKKRWLRGRKLEKKHLKKAKFSITYELLYSDWNQQIFSLQKWLGLEPETISPVNDKHVTTVNWNYLNGCTSEVLNHGY